MRPVRITRKFTEYAEGSVLIEMGRTRVLCTASVEEGVPPFLRGKGQGWITAEYGMLPRSTHTRSQREAAKGKQGGRTVEISRLIGRALRAALDMKLLGERTITIDCDVLQADGGTRCASITGGMVALADACAWLLKKKALEKTPLVRFIAAVSVGMVKGKPTLDLCYEEDSTAGVDLNVIMADNGKYIELQGTAEHEPFSDGELECLKKLARNGIKKLFAIQKKALGKKA